MNALFLEMRSALLATFILSLVCCGFYPFAVYAIAQTIFPAQANGSLILDSRGRVIGSKLLGQGFTAAQYFHPRPSAAGNGYDASNSGGSNLGPTSRKLKDAIEERITSYRKENDLHDAQKVPADAVTASASGLDPHISVSNAMLQAPRVAKARNLPLAQVEAAIRAHITHADFGILGEECVNVLELNLALDNRSNSSAK